MDARLIRGGKIMKICGLDKLSLVDYPHKTCAIIFTAGCNFACPYCHNSTIASGREDIIPEDEVLEYLSKRKNLLDGVCISGGEPLIQPDLVEFMRKVKAMGYDIKLDTNGYLPDTLDNVLKTGLVDYVAMDIKGSLEDYPVITKCRSFDPKRILRSIEILETSGVEHEYRTTYIRDYHKDIPSILSLVPENCTYYIQSFEMSDNVTDRTLSAFSPDELQEILVQAKSKIKNTYLR